MSLLRPPAAERHAQAVECGDWRGSGPWRGSRSALGAPALCDPIGRWIPPSSPATPALGSIDAREGQRGASDPTGAALVTVPAQAWSLNVSWGGGGLQARVILSASCPLFPGGPETTAQPARVRGFRGAQLSQANLRRALGGSVACSGCRGIALK